MTGGANYTGDFLLPDSRFARKGAPDDAGGFVV
jgi:hypothetical protein